ncbi:MAG: substrate-binding domain-containing protein [Spirochaetales bacterium]|nr:substrate-binding domain-containing protein [Spirochaetales bacterium]
MKRKGLLSIVIVGLIVATLFSGCKAKAQNEVSKAKISETKVVNTSTGKTDLADKDFDISYAPQKDSYKIYCTYKNIHSWYDAIKAGVDAAVSDMEKKGVHIDYVWYGPTTPDAIDQVNSIETAVGQGYDLIAVDVNQPETTAKAINNAVDNGVPVATFASSDVANCDRSFFVGNTDNYGDGCTLAKAVCEKMGGAGQIAILAGTMGAASHEARLKGFNDTIAKYPGIKIVDTQRDNDSVEKAISITESWLGAYPDLGAILCNNMSNPVGACQAVKSAGKSGKIIIGGMDHDLRTLQYLKDGTLYIAQVQNCYDMGYKLIYYAVETIDGATVPDSTPVGSTSVYMDDADKFIDMLYGEKADATAR